MKVTLPGNNPSKHVALQTSLSHLSLWAFSKGLSQVHFKMRNDKHKPKEENVFNTTQKYYNQYAQFIQTLIFSYFLNGNWFVLSPK